MTETEKERCREYCAQFGDPPCYADRVCGPGVEVCDDCKDRSLRDGDKADG